MDCSYCVASKIFNCPSIFPESQNYKKIKATLELFFTFHLRMCHSGTQGTLKKVIDLSFHTLFSSFYVIFTWIRTYKFITKLTLLILNLLFQVSTHWKIKMESLIDWQINHKSQNDLVSSSSRLSHGALTGQFQMPDCFWSLWFSVPQCANQPTPITQNSLF